jgi:flagellar basal body-associated protein FliL
MPLYFLDVVEQPWLQRNGRDIIILTVMALIAIAAIVGIFMWIKKRKTAK